MCTNEQRDKPVGGFSLINLLIANQFFIEVRGKRKEREEGQSNS